MCSLIIDVLNELRIDLQDVFWLICEQLNIDGTIIQTSDQVSYLHFFLSLLVITMNFLKYF